MPAPQHLPPAASGSVPSAAGDSPGSLLDCPEIAFATLADFTAHLVRHGISHAVIAWRDEYGPVSLSPEQVSYQHCRDSTVISYHQGTLLRCAGVVLERAELRACLLALGLRVEERCRNLNTGLAARSAATPPASAARATDA